MEIVSNNQSGVEIQLSLFEAIKDLLLINPIFLLGTILIGISLVVIFKKNSDIPKVKTSILSLAMYYYLCVALSHIVGIPTLSECIRLSQLGETFFNPNINLIPFSDGFSLSFILNILLFVPLGFLCPLISKTLNVWEIHSWLVLDYLSLSKLFSFYVTQSNRYRRLTHECNWNNNRLFLLQTDC